MRDEDTPPWQGGPRQPALDLHQLWARLPLGERVAGFHTLQRPDNEELFSLLDAHHQAELVAQLPAAERRQWLRLLPPDDAADLVQAAPAADRDMLLGLLDGPTLKEVTALMAYAEDDAGGLMSPRFARLRPNMRSDEAISYLRKQTRERIEMMNYVYVLDHQQKLLGVVSFRDLFAAASATWVADIMEPGVITVPEEMDQEAVSRLFRQHGLVAMPVVDTQGRMRGVVTVDDIVEVVHEEATEDFHKLGGMEAMEQPYLRVPLVGLIKKRAGWLSALFIGEMFTATALAYFHDELDRMVVLGYFIPLIISSGGNSGAQASTLVIRAMVLGEVRRGDFFAVLRKEGTAGLALGGILGTIGLINIFVRDHLFQTYQGHGHLLAITVAVALVGVVLFGTLAGSGLPFLLKRLGFDPASASGPFVATLVDVTGLVIYFSVARVMMGAFR